MEKRNIRSERIGSCYRVWADVRVTDLLALPFNVERADAAWGNDGALVLIYAAMTTVPPPIKIREVPAGYEVCDGGHRLAVARLRNDEWIPTLELPTR
jgi:hypothetical protein